MEMRWPQHANTEAGLMMGDGTASAFAADPSSRLVPLPRAGAKPPRRLANSAAALVFNSDPDLVSGPQ